MAKLPVQNSNNLKVSKSIDTYVLIPDIGIEYRYRKISIL